MLNGFAKYSDAARLVLRLSIAAIFLYHGYQKLGLWSASADGSAAGMQTIMKILSIAEPLGGLALLLGLWTRLASLGLAIIMIGATYIKAFTWGIGFATPQGPGWEFDLIILAGCLLLLAEGAGAYSLDAKMRKGA